MNLYEFTLRLEPGQYGDGAMIIAASCIHDALLFAKTKNTGEYTWLYQKLIRNTKYFGSRTTAIFIMANIE